MPAATGEHSLLLGICLAAPGLMWPRLWVRRGWVGSQGVSGSQLGWQQVAKAWAVPVAGAVLVGLCDAP